MQRQVCVSAYQAFLAQCLSPLLCAVHLLFGFSQVATNSILDLQENGGYSEDTPLKTSCFYLSAFGEPEVIWFFGDEILQVFFLPQEKTSSFQFPEEGVPQVSFFIALKT